MLRPSSGTKSVLGDPENPSRQTLERTNELRPTVELSRNAGPARIEFVATLDESLAGRDLGPQSLALWTFRVIVHSVGTLASPFWNGGHLLVRVGNSICENDRGKVDLYQTRGRG